MSRIKPIILKIKGLNSFIEEQNIDFSVLGDRGLFGIFGPTGSGKSSILDAMTLALYGKVARTNAHLLGIVNSQSEKINVYYEFAIGQGEDCQTYSVQRVLKRNKNEGSNTIDSRLCSISDSGEIEVLRQGPREVNAGIEEIIGLNADDFTRSVVLPQGNFSEFLRLKGNERRNMLERIFSLEKYGEEMMKRIGRYKSKKKEERNLLEGALALYGDISPEALKQLRQELLTAQDFRHKLEQDLAALQKDFEKYHFIWQWQEELQGYQQEAERLKARTEEFAQRKKDVEMADRAAQLKPLIEKKLEAGKKLNTQKEEFLKMESILKELDRSLAREKEKWQDCSEQRNRQIPQLKEKCAALNRAREIQKELGKLKNEHLQLRKEYQKLLDGIDIRNRKVADKRLNMQKYQDKLEKKLERIAFLKISPEEREVLARGYEKEKAFRLLDNEQKELSVRLDAMAEKLRLAEEELARTEETVRDLDIKYQESLKTKKFLEENSPATDEILLSKQKELSDLQNELKEVERYTDSRGELMRKVAEREKTIMLLEEKLNGEKEFFLKQEAEHQRLQERLEKGKEQNMALVLARKLEEGKACPVCGSVHHPLLPDYMEIEEIAGLENRIKIIEETRKITKDELNKLEVEYRGLIGEIEAKKEEAAVLEDKIADRKIDFLKKEYLYREREFINLQESKKEWEKKLKECEEEISTVREKLSSLESQATGEKTALEKEIAYFQDMQKEMEKLKKEIAGSRQDYEKYLELLGLDIVENRYLQIQENDREMVGLEKEEKELRTAIAGLEEDISGLHQELKDLEIDKERIKERGEGKKVFIESRELELKNLSPEEEPETALKTVEQAITEIEEAYKNAEAKFLEEEKQRAALHEEHSRLSWTIDELERVLAAEAEELERQLTGSAFSTAEEALKAYRPEREREALCRSLEEYRNQVMINSENIKRLEDKLDGETIQEEEWLLLLENKKKMQAELEELNNDFLLKSEKEKELEKKVQELNQLEKKKKKLEQDYGLLLEMESLFKGKKFVEFIARTQLHYIAREASQKLKDISRGRYALELNAEGEFIIRDDFNGGVRRSTQTLSGGETFLASLSLALALSSHIQLGKASLEFFFLDEGFGSLDSEVLEIVMTSLERLQSEKLNVGIISHVEEIKQRIPRKLIVKPPVPGVCGSRVEIEEN